ncbi:MAG: DUF59 domain-containing protein [Alphaproteobacteria bacterium]
MIPDHPGDIPEEDFRAEAGEPLARGTPVAGEDAVVASLRTVYDPEIPINIYDLGLIYKIKIETDGTVLIDMTLTAPGCPVAGDFPLWVAMAVAGVDGVGEVTVRLVWDPPWDVELITEAARLELGLV